MPERSTYFAITSTTGHTYDQQSLFGFSLTSNFIELPPSKTNIWNSESHPYSRIYVYDFSFTCLNMPTFFCLFSWLIQCRRQWIFLVLLQGGLSYYVNYQAVSRSISIAVLLQGAGQFFLGSVRTIFSLYNHVQDANLLKRTGS